MLGRGGGGGGGGGGEGGRVGRSWGYCGSASGIAELRHDWAWRPRMGGPGIGWPSERWSWGGWFLGGGFVFWMGFSVCR